MSTTVPGHFSATQEGGVHLDLRGADLASIAGLNEDHLAKLARIVRGLTFTAVDGAKSGHPGGFVRRHRRDALPQARGGFGQIAVPHPRVQVVKAYFDANFGIGS